MGVRQLGDVHEALDALRHADERSERDELGDLARDDLAGPVLALELLPGVLLGGLQRQRDALALQVDVQDLHLDLLPHVHDLGGVVNVLPGQLGDVDEPVHSAQVHERAEVHDGGDGALAPLPLGQGLQELLAALALGLLQEGPARQHDVVAVPVELDDLGLELLAHEGMEVADPPQVNEGRRQEPAQPDVQDQPALHDLDDRPLDGPAAGHDLLNPAPGPLVLGPLLGQDETALLILLLEDQGLDRIADAHHL